MRTKYFSVFLVLLLSLITGNVAAQRCLTFSYDADGNRVQRTVTYNCNVVRGFDEVQEVDETGDMLVYPNPTEGLVRIKMPDYESPMCYAIYGISGLKIAEGKLYDEETDLDIGNFPVGTYLLRVVSDRVQYSKVIVKH